MILAPVLTKWRDAAPWRLTIAVCEARLPMTTLSNKPANVRERGDSGFVRGMLGRVA